MDICIISRVTKYYSFNFYASIQKCKNHSLFASLTETVCRLDFTSRLQFYNPCTTQYMAFWFMLSLVCVHTKVFSIVIFSLILITT